MPRRLPLQLRKGWLALPVLLLAVAAFALRQQNSRPVTKPPRQQMRSQKMDIQFTRYGGEPVAMPPLKSVHPAAATGPIPDTVPEPGADVVQQFVNPERNSRLGAALGPLRAESSLRWHAAVSDVVEPSVLLASHGRILGYGMSAWQLFDRDGKPVRHGQLRNSVITLDPERSLFYGEDHIGLIAARSLTDGADVFTMSLHHTDDFGRRFISRYGPRLVTLGYEIPIDLHAPSTPTSIAEVTDVSDPNNRKSWLDPGSPTVVQNIVANTSAIAAAMHGDSLVLVVVNGVLVLDSELEVRHALTGTFTPGPFSLDEAGRIYLTVQSNDERSLWLLQPDGERLYSFRLPPGITNLIAPPIVGYNHVVYLISPSHIFAVGQDGKLNWSREAQSLITGAVVTADDQLLTSEGNQVAAWDAKGERRVVYTFPETLTTAPILTANGELVVASHTSIFCAARQ